MTLSSTHTRLAFSSEPFRLVSLLSFLLFAWMLSGPVAGAAGCNPCEIYVMPNTKSITIPLEGLLHDSVEYPNHVSQNRTTTNLLYGTASFDYEMRLFTYSPNPEFWIAGSDQASFAVHNTVDKKSYEIRSLVFLAGGTESAGEARFNFESAPNLDAWEVFPTVDENTMNRPLTVTLQEEAMGNCLETLSTPGIDRGVSIEHNSPATGEQAQSVELEAQAGATEPGGGGWDPTDLIRHLETYFGVSGLDLEDILSIGRLTEINPDGTAKSFIRGVMSPTYFECTERPENVAPGEEDLYPTPSPCETRWIELTGPELLTVKVEVALRILGAEVAKPWSLQARVENSETGAQEGFEEEWTTLHTQLPADLVTRVGSMDVHSTDPSELVKARILDAKMTVKHFSGYPNTFSESFNNMGAHGAVADELAGTGLVQEGGEAHYWDEIPTQEEVENDRNFAIDLLKLVPSSAPSGYVTAGEAGDRSTLTYDALTQEDEVRIKMAVYTRPRVAQAHLDYFPAWTIFDLLQVGSVDGVEGYGPAKVGFSTDAAGNRRFRLRAYGNGGGFLNSGWINAGDSHDVSLTLHVKRNTNGSENPNGSVSLTVNGQTATLSGINNSNLFTEYVTFGAWNLNLNGLPAQDVLPLGFDDLVIVGDPD